MHFEHPEELHAGFFLRLLFSTGDWIPLFVQLRFGRSCIFVLSRRLVIATEGLLVTRPMTPTRPTDARAGTTPT
jgi:hypothetical protein